MKVHNHYSTKVFFRTEKSEKLFQIPIFIQIFEKGAELDLDGEIRLEDIGLPTNVKLLAEPFIQRNPTPRKNSGQLLSVAEGCGYSKVSTSKIVGGSVAKNGAYPWLALIGMSPYGYFYIPIAKDRVISKVILYCRLQKSRGRTWSR